MSDEEQQELEACYVTIANLRVDCIKLRSERDALVTQRNEALAEVESERRLTARLASASEKARAELLAAHQIACKAGLERDQLRACVSELEAGGAWKIMLERKAHHSRKGWSAEHDDGHTDGELAVQSAMLACIGTGAVVQDLHGRIPWRTDYPSRIRELVVAGSLIAAEIDRLERREVEAEIEQQEKSAIDAAKEAK